MRIKKLMLKIDILYYYLSLIISKIIIEYKNFSLSPDISQQLHSLYNFTHGKGITSGFFNTGKIEFIKYNYNSSGLAILLFPIDLVVNNTIVSVFILCIINVLFFVFFLRKINQLLRLDSWLERIVVVFFIFTVSPFVYHWPADALAMTCCLWGFYFSIKHTLSKKMVDRTV